MPVHTLRPTVATLADLALCTPAWADRPLVSETADVIGSGDCQIETGLARATASGQASATALDALFSCGVAGHSQFGVGLATVRAGGASDKALGLGGKTNLVALQDGQTGLALAYGVTWNKPAGASWGHGSTRLFGVATRQLTKALLAHLNLGWLRTENDRLNSTTWSLGVEGEGPIRWAADVYGDDRAKPWASAGVVFAMADKVSGNLAYGVQFDAPRTRLLTLGFKFEF